MKIETGLVEIVVNKELWECDWIYHSAADKTYYSCLKRDDTDDLSFVSDFYFGEVDEETRLAFMSDRIKMKIKKPVTMAMIRDLVVDLAKNEDGYYDPVEVESFTFDSGYYTAMLLMGEEPGADDLELYESRLKLKR